MTTFRSTLIAASTCLALGLSHAAAHAEDQDAPAKATESAPATEAKPAESAATPAADAALAQIDAFIAEKKINTSANNWKTKLPKPPRVTFTKDKKYFWDLDTNKGKISIELMPDIAPMHVSSTIYLTRLGFYDKISFHRVIPGFMAQGGDPLGTGTGDPGYEYDGEFSSSVKHDRKGRLSMANAGPGTDGSQFFLTFTSTPHLDGRHTIFGQVQREGMETLAALEKLGSNGAGTPKEPLEITKATIRVN